MKKFFLAVALFSPVALAQSDVYLRSRGASTNIVLDSTSDTVITVQDDGSTSCPDGGNVCSGSVAPTCNANTNVDSCTVTLKWARVGNIVTVGLTGSLDPSSTGVEVEIDFAAPNVGTNFGLSAGGGVCTFKSSAFGTADDVGNARPENGTQNIHIRFNNVTHTLANPLDCAFSYQIP